MRVTGYIIAAALCLLAVSVAAAPLTAVSGETAKIGWDVPEGKTCTYGFSDHSDVKSDASSKPEGEEETRQNIAVSAVFDGPVTVKGSGGGGVGMEMHLQRKSLKPDPLPEGANIPENIDGKATFGPDGKLTADTGSNSYLYFIMAFNVPRVDLEEGAPSIIDLSFPDESMPLAGKAAYTLQEIKEVNGRRCAVYDVKSSLANDRTGHTEESHLYVDIKGDMRCAFSLDDGCLVSAKGKITSTTDVKLDAMGVKLKLDSEMTSNVEAELTEIN